MATFIGLNLRFLLNDAFDKNAALRNIGLNREDLERISGLSEAIKGGDTGEREDMRTLSNLDLDQEKELYALRISGEAVSNNVIGIGDIGQPLDLDILQSGAKLVASAIKYNYLNVADRTTFNPETGTNFTFKQADISTSRVSSWSSAASPAISTSPIFYGGEVEIKTSDITYTDKLMVEAAPERIRYEAEVPTHTVSVNINGTTQKFLAMKGIPLQFEGFFRNADLSVDVNFIQNSNGDDISPVWRIVNQDASNREYENTSPPIGINSPWRYRDVQNRPRLVELYYNPLNITKIRTRSINMSELPNVPLENLETLDVMFNDFYEVPNLKTIAPNIEELYLQGNNLSRSPNTGNTQINANVPTSIRVLNINGVFSDSTALDLTNFNNLEVLDFHSYYKSRTARAMTGGTYTPAVWSTGSGASRNTVIRSYNVGYQPYDRLHETIDESNSLTYINMQANNITGVGSDNRFIKFANSKNTLRTIYSYSNNHNFIDVSNNTALVRYEHVWSSLRNEDGLGGINGIYIDGKLSGCTSLQVFIPVGVNLHVKNESVAISAFKNLPALYYTDLRWTSMAGYFDSGSFSGTPNLRYLFIRHGRWNPTDKADYKLFDDNNNNTVFGDNTPNFYYLIVQYNKRIRGTIPDFSKNKNFRVCQIQGTSMSGTIPTFNNNKNMGYVYLQDNEFSGNVPAFSGGHFLYIYLNDNNLNGQVEPLNCSGLRRLYAYNNNLFGPLPTFSGCTSIEYLKLQNNAISSCAKGTFNLCTQIRQIDLSNNNLDTNSAQNIIADMVVNYGARNRGGVIINLQGNPRIDSNTLFSNPAIVEQINLLRAVGWQLSL